MSNKVLTTGCILARSEDFITQHRRATPKENSRVGLTDDVLTMTVSAQYSSVQTVLPCLKSFRSPHTKRTTQWVITHGQIRVDFGQPGTLLIAKSTLTLRTPTTSRRGWPAPSLPQVSQHLDGTAPVTLKRP